MDYKQFKDRYYAQLNIGAALKTVTDYHLPIDISGMGEIAELICPDPENISDNHWLKQPVSVDLSWKKYCETQNINP